MSLTRLLHRLHKTKYYSAINFILPGSAVVEPILAGSDKGEYVLDLTSGSATENDRIKANDLARYFEGLIDEGKIGSSDFSGNPKLYIDLDKDGSYDILQTWINSRMGGIDSFTFTTLSTNSVKGSITLAISNEKLRSIMEGGSDTYSKVTFVFEKPGTPASAEQDAAKVADAANGHKVGDKVSNGGATYTITSVEDGKQAVTYVKPDAKDVKNAVIPDAINIDGTDYKVTEIAAGAFKNNKKLKKTTIGSNIKKIGKDAYKGCKNLKSIKIKTVLLTKKSVGSGAFKNIHKAAKCKVPKKVLKNYQKFLIKKGLNGKGQKITK